MISDCGSLACSCAAAPTSGSDGATQRDRSAHCTNRVPCAPKPPKLRCVVKLLQAGIISHVDRHVA
eukprot:4820541-Prymnesium_polylepis.2